MPTKRTTETKKKAAPQSKAAPKAKAKSASRSDNKLETKSRGRDSGRDKPEAREPEQRLDRNHTDRQERQPERQEARRPEPRQRPAGATALSGGEFIIGRKMSGKTVDSPVGARLRVELPENSFQGHSWHLQKLPHGLTLDLADVKAQEAGAGPDHRMTTQNRVFNFSVNEPGDYVLQFNLERGYGQQGFADTFKVKVHAESQN